MSTAESAYPRTAKIASLRGFSLGLSLQSSFLTILTYPWLTTSTIWCSSSLHASLYLAVSYAFSTLSTACWRL